MLLPSDTKNQTVVIHVVEEPDSVLLNIFTFLASLSFVILFTALILIFWARPAAFESVAQPTRELLQQFKLRMVARLMGTSEMIAIEPAASVEDVGYQATPVANSIPTFMTADELLKEVPTPSMVLADEQRAATLRPEMVLSDPQNRISEEFHIPEALKRRVAFWFDIYTKHSSLVHVIHHDRFPWIIYRIVDTTPFMATRGPEWLRRQRGIDQAHLDQKLIQKTLAKLAARTSYSTLSALEFDLYKKLLDVPGPRKKVLRLAAESVRDQLGQRDFYINGLRNSARYLPYMEEEMKRRGLPTELTRLPFVESSFNEKAESRVGASGIWQIMPRTGKAYLIVNENIDERNAPLKATKVAAYIFKSYNHALKSWPLTITSYNHGIGNIQIAIRKGRSRDLPTIIERYHDGDFKFASSNFFTCFLAALYAEKYQEVVFPTLSKLGLQERETWVLSKRIRVTDLMRLARVEPATFLDYNLDLKHALQRRAVLPVGYEVHLPLGAREVLLGALGQPTLKTPSKTADTTPILNTKGS